MDSNSIDQKPAGTAMTLNKFLESMAEEDTLVFDNLAQEANVFAQSDVAARPRNCLELSHAIIAVREAPLHWKQYQPLLKAQQMSCRDFGSNFPDWADFSSYLRGQAESFKPTLWVLLDQAIEALGGLSLAPAEMWQLALERNQFVLVLTRNLDLLRIPSMLYNSGFDSTLRLPASGA